MIELKKLILNEFFYNSKGEKICQLLDDGKVIDKYKEILSIHKMSAKELKKVNNNGWEYFFVIRNGELKSINDFRYEVNNE